MLRPLQPTLAHARRRMLCRRWYSDTASTGKPLTVLGIESSCDDTCVAVLSVQPPLTNSSSAQTNITTAAPDFSASVPRASLLYDRRVTSSHVDLKGIHPVIAARSHRANLPRLLAEAVKHLPNGKPDIVAVTRGPGQVNALDIGLHVAKGLAFAWNVPLLGVNHMVGHAITVRLVGALKAHARRNQAVAAIPTTNNERNSSSSSSSNNMDKYLNIKPVTTTSPNKQPRTPSADEHLAAAGYPSFPYLSLLVSGGHTLLVLSRSLTDHSILADTLDTAAGDCIDKIARILLPQSILDNAKNTNYGRLLESYTFPSGGTSEEYDYNPNDKSIERNFEAKYGWNLPKPLEGVTAEHKGWLKFSFAGLRAHLDRNFGIELEKTAGSDKNIVTDEFRRILGYLSQRRAFEHLASRVLLGLQHLAKVQPELKIRDLVVSGGVASNGFLREVLRRYLEGNKVYGLRIHYPPVELCTDNAAMIAWTGYEMFREGWETELGVGPLKKWALDGNVEEEERRKYDGKDYAAWGVLEAEGWKKRKAF